MTNEQINAEIAKVCGWIDVWRAPNASETAHFVGTSPSGEFLPVPNYCNDLNAMREALELISEQCKDSDFWFFLRKIIGFPDAESDWDEYLYFEAINATARQRAEAFLRTLEKWEEVQDD